MTPKKINSRNHHHVIIGTNSSGDRWRFSAASASGPMKSSLRLERAGWVRLEQAQSAPTQINVVLNWFEELKHRVPAGK
jgi:hypothetical protein